MLCRNQLPWVKSCKHLGNTIVTASGGGDIRNQDVKNKRAAYIDNSVKIQETFGFANPPEVLRAVQTYAGHWYGSMLWDLFGQMAGQIYNSWFTTVKVTWDPRSYS